MRMDLYSGDNMLICYSRYSFYIQGRGYIILNAKDKIKDTIIGTITSILSHSAVYDQETILIGMAYDILDCRDRVA